MVVNGWLTAKVTGLIVTLVALILGFGRAWTAPSDPGHKADSVVDIRIRTFTQQLDSAQVAATSAQEWATIARTNDIVVLNSWNFGLIPVLKRANPHVQVWVYKDLSGVRSDDCATPSGACGSCPPGVTDRSYLSSGMGYCWVLRHDPTWLLKSAATGQPFQFRGWSHIWETDYGNPTYQHQWIANVLADVRSHGWDGVDIDDALTTSDYGVAAKYPTSTAIQAATYSALQLVGPALRKAGIASVVNVGYAPRFPGLWEQWLGPVGGLEQQFYLYGAPSTGATGNEWQVYENEISACAAQHKSCWFSSGDFSSSVIRRIRDYVLGSFLLATNGKQFLSYGNALSRLAKLCPALGPAVPGSVKLTGSVWRRSFAHGTALVNPSSSGQDVLLSGGAADKVGPASGTVLSSPGHSCL